MWSRNLTLSLEVFGLANLGSFGAVAGYSNCLHFLYNASVAESLYLSARARSCSYRRQPYDSG